MLFDWFFLIKAVGVLMALAGLAVMPKTNRPMIACDRRRYDKRMRAALRLMIPAAILVGIGVGAQSARMAQMVVSIALLTIGVSSIRALWRMRNDIDTTGNWVNLFAALFGTLGGLALFILSF